MASHKLGHLCTQNSREFNDIECKVRPWAFWEPVPGLSATRLSVPDLFPHISGGTVDCSIEDCFGTFRGIRVEGYVILPPGPGRFVRCHIAWVSIMAFDPPDANCGSLLG